MKLQLTTAEGQNLITGYGEGYISVNAQRYTRSMIVTPDRVVTQWEVQDFAVLEAAHFRALLEFKPEIVLLGTGERQRFPRPELARVFAEASVGFEAMDSKAACRTYNILMSEGRGVLAAILIC
ncbi:MAG: Mth938-like domain-containing protein [Burkholderiales bacterium]